VHALLRLPWAAAGAAAQLAAALAPRGNAKWQRAVRARHGAADRWHTFAALRDTTRPLCWLHAPSVGEGLQALPVAERLRALPSPPQLAITWFSPSAEAFAPRFSADFSDYLLFDTAANAQLELDVLRPSALVYSKLDVWPVLTETAARRGVPLGMIAATLRPDSGRTRPLARALLRDAYAALDLVGAIADDDAERLVALGVRREVIRVTGDSRYDQVWERSRRPPADAAWRTLLADDRPTLVAGSTWPADEAALLAAWSIVRRHLPTARLVIAPHEPTTRHLAPIRRWAGSEGLSLATLDDAAPQAADVVLVDRVGVLGDLYGLATVAFVGGGFHRAGLHSVLEPAAFGVPVVWGPHDAGNRDAQALLSAEGGARCREMRALAIRLESWLRDRRAARDSGAAAQRVVMAGLGAADRATALVRSLIGD
jgi:3-deoxy-D-manno-octulosonic-acid transferase